MAIKTFPTSGGKVCENESCRRKAEWERKKFEKYGSIGERLLEAFLRQEHAESLFRLSEHVKLRAFQKAFSEKRLFELVESGYVISFEPRENTVIVMGYMKLGKREYRPFHIPIIFREKDGEITAFVKTAFDPKFSSHLYDKTLQHRHCWCQPLEVL